jgi:mevalonate kinase
LAKSWWILPSGLAKETRRWSPLILAGGLIGRADFVLISVSTKETLALPSGNPLSKIQNLKSKIGRGVAPGKVILCGEHAVVYGQPALAVPVNGVSAGVQLEFNPATGLQVRSLNLDDLPAPERQRVNLRLQAVAERVRDLIAQVVAEQGGINHTPTDGGAAQRIAPAWSGDLLITIDSSIPIERGLGSGAAIGVAMIRALADYLGLSLSNEQVSAMAYETEKLHHGTPSGIDNAVVAYQQPIYFIRQQPIELLRVGAPLQLLIGDSGTRGSTGAIVGGVRERRNADPLRYDKLLGQIGDISREAKSAVERGDIAELGQLFDRNGELLGQIEVSSPALERLCAAARQGGALGAKLSGAGRGGNMIALVTPATKDAVQQALLAAGAVNVIETMVAPKDAEHI